MKKVGMMTIALLLTIVAGAQTLNVQVGDVTYQFPAAQTGDMTYSNGTTLTIMGKEFAISDITGMVVDKSEVTDNQVTVSYNGTTAKVTVAGNVAQYLTPVVSGSHVSIAQSDDLAEEVTYTLSGESTDGEFYMSGSYKATVELNGLTLTNTTPVKSGAAVHIQNGKRIKVKVCNGTVNTLTDAVGGSQKGCLYVKGHAEFAQKGTLNIIGNVKHGIKTGEYMTLKNATINITKAAGDGINCAQFFQMTSGKIAISGVSDDGIQCDIEDSTVGSTGETTDHEDEDTGNIYLEGGDITASVTADAAKAIKAEGDIRATGTNVTATTSGGGVWDADKVKTKSSSCMSADGNMLISGGTLTLTSTGAGGKGINVDGNFTATGGSVTINTSGNAVVASSTGTLSVVTSSQQLDNYDSDYKSSPKGIKVDGAIVISDNAVISVTTTGAGGEGIESKTSIDITGGQTTVNASDDGINASKNTSTGGSGDLTISGGYVFSKSSGNDGIDANGNCYIKGGLVYAIGTTAPEKSIDANTEEGKKLYITGGTIIAVGDLENGASISGGTCKSASSWTANTWHALYNGGTLVAAFKTPASSGNSGGGPGGWPGGGGPGGGPGGGSQKLIVYTSSTPTVKSGVTVADGTEYFGGMANIGGTVSGGSDVTLSNYSSGGGWW
ncbi:MAG: carbohydrate-binding domain-containing protein [Prevotella sp.]|nr:carbohydrate-binding domain-containing protein [Prevotella sp.]